MENKVTTKIMYCFSIYQMYEHGYYDPHLKKWHCSYFMDEEEWLNIHDYLPNQFKEYFSNNESSEENDKIA
ncbi:MAG: hypothetical protein ACR2F1_02035 [Nitrososphaeraceae archaeon]